MFYTRYSGSLRTTLFPNGLAVSDVQLQSPENNVIGISFCSILLQEEARSCKPFYETFISILLSASLTGETQVSMKKILCASFTFIHSIFSLPSDRSIASSKASSPHNAIQCFLFRYPVFCVSGSCLRLLLHLPVASILPIIFPSSTCFRRQFVRKM